MINLHSFNKQMFLNHILREIKYWSYQLCKNSIWHLPLVTSSSETNCLMRIVNGCDRMITTSSAGCNGIWSLGTSGVDTASIRVFSVHLRPTTRHDTLPHTHPHLQHGLMLFSDIGEEACLSRTIREAPASLAKCCRNTKAPTGNSTGTRERWTFSVALRSCHRAFIYAGN